MNSIKYIKNLELIREMVFLSDDINEETPVDVYFDKVWMMYYCLDANNNISVYQLMKNIGELNVYHLDEILKSTLGFVPKGERVTPIDVFLHGKYIQPINYDKYNITYNNKTNTIDCMGISILDVEAINLDVILEVCQIYSELANLMLVDEFLLNSDLCTQCEREDIIEGLARHYTVANKDGFIMNLINQIEKDINNQEYTSLYKMLDILYENQNTKDILDNYLND